MRWREEDHFSTKNILGEGPLWHPNEARLYWVDIDPGLINTIDPATMAIESIRVGHPVGSVAFCENGDLIIAGQKGFERWSSNSGEIIPLIDPEPDRTQARFNDGRIDSHGRFWAGTMTPQGFENSLYRLNSDNSCTRVETKVGISNGIGWSPDRRKMYFTDSARQVIYSYDYDELNGAISNRYELISTQTEEGVPDGLAVDREGCLWSARWDGWKIVRYSPTGEKMDEIDLPVQRPTSCAFGGRNLNILYVTSASIDLTEKQREHQPHAGDLFWIETDTKGCEEHYFSD